MQIIQNLTSDALQQQTIVLPNGLNLLIQLYYIPNNYGWFFTKIIYGLTSANPTGIWQLYGLRASNNPNMLRQFKNIIPFGIACYTSGNREPTQQQDFESGASKLYLLNQTDIADYEAALPSLVVS